ncbi:segregation and condensation protein A [Furfurilactobacillus cerevisiae]|uniref:segregation and condensation protein A n=1 Tax=Furfurilactobacillus rossiae TaxID=231049 RepID=UPI003B984DB9
MGANATDTRKSWPGQRAHDREAQVNLALANQPTIKIADFEGPLDLLLHLIRSSEMDIYDIQISAITSQYLKYLHQMQNMKLDVAGEYFVMAATLMTIKSRMLLPRAADEDEDATDNSDPRSELVTQLLEYRRYQQAADELRDKEQDRKQQFTRAASGVPADVQLGSLVPGITVADLQAAFKHMLAQRQIAKPVSRTVSGDQFTIREQMRVMLNKLDRKRPTAFEDLFSEQPQTDELVTTFLAMLELAKMNAVRFDQSVVNGPIQVFAGERSKDDLDKEVLTPFEDEKES